MLQTRSSSIQQNRDLWDRIWRDRRGDIVIWQLPNIPQIAWVALTLGSLFTTGTLSNILWYAATAALAVWALLELLRGVNYFRRILGIVVLLLIVAAYLKVGY
jgi:hypothetical protein